MHDPRSDLEALELLGINIRSWKRDLHSLLAKIDNPAAGETFAGIWVLDSQALFCGWKREKRKSKLEMCCEAMKVPTRRLHNAGNGQFRANAFVEVLHTKGVDTDSLD